MRRTYSAIALASIAVLSLGGCKGLLVARQQPSIRAAGMAQAEDPRAFATAQLIAGRQALANGNFGAAIAAFSNIRSMNGYEGEAYNGLAVAYSGIGRRDLAEAYFRRAVEVAPWDSRFQHNLAMLQSSGSVPAPVMAPREQKRAPALAVNSPVRIETAGSQIVRLSSQQVLIRTAPAAAAPDGSRRQQYPVRVELVRTGARQLSIASSAPAGRGYPIRVEFGRGLKTGAAR